MLKDEEVYEFRTSVSYEKEYAVTILEYIFKGLLLVLCIIGLVLYAMEASSFEGLVQLLFYFTIQTNLVLAILLVLSLYLQNKEKKWLWVNISLSTVSLWILHSGLIYIFFLSGTEMSIGLSLCASVMLHIITPISALILYLFFQKDTYSIKWRIRRVGIFLIYPAVYVAIILIRGLMIDVYPYWFLNPVMEYPEGTGSYINLILIVVLIYFTASLVGLVLYNIQKFTSRV